MMSLMAFTIVPYTVPQQTKNPFCYLQKGFFVTALGIKPISNIRKDNSFCPVDCPMDKKGRFQHENGLLGSGDWN